MNTAVNLDDRHIIDLYDSQKMIEILHDFPNHCSNAYLHSKKIEPTPLKNNINNIIVLGMGGSSIAGDMLKNTLLSELAVPIIVNRDYDIPHFVNENTLALVVSYSGETEETLSAFNQALEKKANIITFSTGGALKEASLKNNIYHVELPLGFMPRAALAYLFFPLLETLIKLKLISNKDKEIEELFNLLKFLHKSWKFDIPTEQNLAKKLAQRFYNKIPVIYTNSGYLESVALRWKNQINENSKALAHINCFPEILHNEVAAYTKNISVYENLSVLFLIDPEYKNVTRQVISLKQIIQNYLPIMELNPLGDLPLEKMISLTYLGDFVSVYLAYLYQQDPTPIQLIERIKSKR